MINLDSITNENNKKHNEKWPYIPDHLYRILIIGGSGSGKTNALLHLIMIQVHLLSVQIQWMTFMRILMVITQAEKEKF